ncbi:MAG: cation diffusion facilitator family transporter [Actinomycetes bacterium]
MSLSSFTDTADGSPSLTRWAWLSITAALATIGLKFWAYYLTGSVGLLSDALESIVNLAAAIIALIALTIASRPADIRHHFGHGKAEYLSAGIEGLMIFVAALVILIAAIQRLIDPNALEEVGIGLIITMAATAINAVVGSVILRVGRKHRSITLVADGKHLLTDVWTSIGVIIGVGLVALTGWLPLDSLVAIAVGLNICWVGFGLLRSAVRGLMDHAMAPEDEATVFSILQSFVAESPRHDLAFHALQTRESGRERFISMHVLVPGKWTITEGHDLVERVEDAIKSALPNSRVLTHLEPLEDRRAYDDAGEGHTGLDTSRS